MILTVFSLLSFKHQRRNGETRLAKKTRKLHKQITIRTVHRNCIKVYKGRRVNAWKSDTCKKFIIKMKTFICCFGKAQTSTATVHLHVTISLTKTSRKKSFICAPLFRMCSVDGYQWSTDGKTLRFFTLFEIDVYDGYEYFILHFYSQKKFVIRTKFHGKWTFLWWIELQ